jgi:23S rRNA (cytosine1962-C5)-methyltransferase
VKRTLPDLRQKGQRFGMVIIDPPKLAPTSRHLESGRKAYRRLNAAALRVVEDGGLLVSCSCSGAVKPGGFLRTIGLAAKDARRRVTLLYTGQQGPDHPTPAAFPEGRYLKMAVLKVD